MVCRCGAFAHDIDVMWMARLAVRHDAHKPLFYPSDYYAEMANDMFAEADWVISP